MKKHFLFAAVAALMTCACSVEPVDTLDVQPEEKGEYTILTAGFAGDDAGGTRTIRQADGKVYWSANDEISVVRGTNVAGNKFVSTNSAPAPRVAFEGVMPDGTGDFWAVHPYDPDAYFDGEYLVVTLPDAQEAVPDTFADDLFISVAYAKDESLSFYHVVGGLKFSVTEPGVKKVTLIANGDEPLAGLMGILNYNGRPTFGAWGTTSSQIELSPASGSFEVGKAYHFVTLPQTLSSGISLLFEKEDGSLAYRTVNKSVTIDAAHFKTMMEATLERFFQDDVLVRSGLTYREALEHVGRKAAVTVGWVITLACIGVIILAEFGVDRWGNQLLAYGVMTACLAVIAVVGADFHIMANQYGED